MVLLLKLVMKLEKEKEWLIEKSLNFNSTTQQNKSSSLHMFEG
jgi:hypothetical protein